MSTKKPLSAEAKRKRAATRTKQRAEVKRVEAKLERKIRDRVMRKLDAERDRVQKDKIKSLAEIANARASVEVDRRALERERIEFISATKEREELQAAALTVAERRRFEFVAQNEKELCSMIGFYLIAKGLTIFDGENIYALLRGLKPKAPVETDAIVNRVRSWDELLPGEEWDQSESVEADEFF